jgi:dimethylargininase
MQQCELTYSSPVSIDYELALAQHEQYRRMLGRCGCEVIVLDVNREMPDCCFIEDTAIVLDELAIVMSMGAASRRAEPQGIEAELRKHRPIAHIELPATIDGGDVLRLGRTLLVGLSSRTNASGAAALQAIVQPLTYRVVPVRVARCLHLKSACTALPDGRLLVNPDWIDMASLRSYELLEIPPSEPAAANVLSIGQTVCTTNAFAHTAESIRGLGIQVETVDLSEFAKAEGGVTCLSLLV